MKFRFESENVPEWDIVLRANITQVEADKFFEFISEYEQPVLQITDRLNGRHVRIYMHDIVAIQVQKNNLQIETSTDTYEIRSTLASFMAKLDKYFVQVSRSSAIQLRLLKEVKIVWGNAVAVLAGGKEVEISRRYLSSLKAQLEELRYD
jgi:DNA-binding LytR/AlgR family response regulator